MELILLKKDGVFIFIIKEESGLINIFMYLLEISLYNNIVYV